MFPVNVSCGLTREVLGIWTAGGKQQPYRSVYATLLCQLTSWCEALTGPAIARSSLPFFNSFSDSWKKHVYIILWQKTPASVKYPCHQEQRQQEWTWVSVHPHGIPVHAGEFQAACDLPLLPCRLLQIQKQRTALQRRFNQLSNLHEPIPWRRRRKKKAWVCLCGCVCIS